MKRFQVVVWDPVTGDQHRIAVPPGFDGTHGAVLCATRDKHFQVVLVVRHSDDEQHTRAVVCVYSSKTGLWGDRISTPLPYQPDVSGSPNTMLYELDAVLVGDSLHWMLSRNFGGILKFDLEKQSLAMIRVPLVDMYGQGNYFQVMRAEGGGLGFLFMSVLDYAAQLWKRKTDCDGVASWELGRTIQLDKLLSLKSEDKNPIALSILGFAEQNNAVFIWTVNGIFMIHLDSLNSRSLPKPPQDVLTIIHSKVSTLQASLHYSGD
ncbi:unnamed protein product [Triticum turgidum subsp. durum]|uniref:F-box protein AT5G49610-like beta-propeller domain-containing protein n=1 Tax=Triticum turgidum subsp. durum TaxID=4567 RepID=A0A9R1AWF2_TRITD|nr:unnamed protein product [Triticum turgidum subsp. durum]